MCQKTKQLLKLVHVGDLEALKQHQTENPNLQWNLLRYPSTGDTILHVAARLGHLHILTYLLQNSNVLINCRNNDNKTALHEAAQFGQSKAVKILLENGAEVDALKKADWTPLMLSCTKVPDVETVRVLLEGKAVVNFQNKDGWTVLHLIARDGRKEIFELLQRYNLDINRITKNGRTALHIAALNKNLEMLKILNIDVNIKDNCGNTALQEAVLSGDLTILQELLHRENVDVFTKNSAGFTLLHSAASVGSEEMLLVVLDLGVGINETTKDGFTALHCASRKGFRNIYDLLLLKGADEMIPDKHGRLAKEYF